MVKSIQASEVRALLEEGIPLLDARSEGEFAKANVPGSVSYPLFNNEERARVGTTYKQVGQQEAILLGLEIVGPKMRRMVEHAMELAPCRKIMLYCWRGGMRSGSVGWLLGQAGFEVYLVNGGYKAWRRHALGLLALPWNLRVLGGSTGSGKTHVLEALAELGAPVVDLEAMACHRGSAFGSIGMPPQPTVEMFENRLAFALEKMDINQTIWLEDESRMIGRVFISDPFWPRMQAAPTWVLDVSLDQRVRNLVVDYAGLPKELLAESIGKIARKLGPQHAKTAIEDLEAGHFDVVARQMLVYYDKAYAHSLEQKTDSAITRIPVGEGQGYTEIARNLLVL